MAKLNESRETLGSVLSPDGIVGNPYWGPVLPGRTPEKETSSDDKMYIVLKVGHYGLSDYREKLLAVAGTTVEVETDYLFVDQYNTPAILGVSECGLRVMQSDVERVINDQRPDAGQCERCCKTLLHAVSRHLLGSLCPSCGGQFGPMRDRKGYRVMGTVKSCPPRKYTKWKES